MSNPLNRILLALVLASAACVPAAVAAAKSPSQVSAPAAATAGRERINIDSGWRFAFGHPHDAAKDFGHGTGNYFFSKAGNGDGPAGAEFPDAAWRKVDLPHDWAVEQRFDARASTSHGSLAVGRNFPESSVGWYRKLIRIPAADKGRRISIEFDGVYRNSTVWVNGHYIGTEPSGYSSFRYDITDYLNVGGDNLVAVRVDATVEEGWFYEGAGIYRHVWLTKTAPLHVAHWGTFVKPKVEGAQASVAVDVSIANDGKLREGFTLRHQLIGPDGKPAGQAQQASLALDGSAEAGFKASLRVPHPRLWSLEQPNLYTLTTTVLQGGREIDRYDTRFGIRTVVFDKDKGFFLNGKAVRLQGTNNHQDHAGVGVALPDGLQTWRLKRLKSFGVNAYRASHHPPTPELLDEADRLGMLVIDEHRMMGTTPELRGQLERMVRRDRNHPSVILWSVGNEEWALEWKELGTHLAREMQDTVHRLDPTRRTTLAASGSGAGTSIAADVIGFNYAVQHDVDKFHRDHPEKPAIMTEEGTTYATRGIYVDAPAHVHLNAYDNQPRPGSSLSIEEGWRRVMARDWMGGMFVWTGFDYRGETTPFGWPAVSSQFGMIDTTGVLKDTAYYLKSVWTDQPMVHILPHWNWAGQEGQPVKVHVYSNGDAVELFQDGRSLGRKAMVKLSKLEWMVPYRAGKLTATAYRGGQAVASAEVATTGAPAQVKLSADKAALAADGRDVAVVWVNVADREGRIVPTADDMVRFATSGPIRIIGVGNGDPGSHEPDRPAERHAFHDLSGWRVLATDSADQPQAVADTADVSLWRDPSAWVAPAAQPPRTSHLVLRGQFARPAIQGDTRLALFIDRLGADQKVYLNGQQVQPKEVDGALVLELEAASLKASNSLAYVVSTPQGGVQGMYDASATTRKWGVLRATESAAPWQRSVFNGWAQVIVQSTGQPGVATLSATSGRLTETALRFELR